MAVRGFVLKSWDEFEDIVRKAQEEHAAITEKIPLESQHSILYRGIPAYGSLHDTAGHVAQS